MEEIFDAAIHLLTNHSRRFFRKLYRSKKSTKSNKASFFGTPPSHVNSDSEEDQFVCTDDEEF
jgi:hypothetical protein